MTNDDFKGLAVQTTRDILLINLLLLRDELNRDDVAGYASHNAVKAMGVVALSINDHADAIISRDSAR